MNTLIKTDTLVFRASDDSTEPLIGRCLGREDEERVVVAWGDARHQDDTANAAAVLVCEDDLRVWTHETQERIQYVAGLRQLADILAAHPEVPLPFTGSGSPLAIQLIHAADAKQTLADCIRAFPGSKQKDAWEGESGTAYLEVNFQLAGLSMKLLAYREQVCERIVTGTREVATEVPDPEALAAVPTITKTETVEDVEWVCTPLLAASPVSA